jgi:hypothetical protein
MRETIVKNKKYENKSKLYQRNSTVSVDWIHLAQDGLW